MIDMAEFLRQATELIRKQEPDASVCVDVTIWNYRHHSQPHVVFTIWDGHKHFEGGTPDVAFNNLRLEYQQSVLNPEELQEVHIPEEAAHEATVADPVA